MKGGNDKGFTLVEMLTVVVIIGVLAIFTVPNFTRENKRRDLESILTQIRQDVLTARGYALRDQIPYVVQFENNYYFIFRDDNKNDTKDANERNIATRPNYPAGISISPSTNKIILLPKGYLKNSNTVTVQGSVNNISKRLIVRRTGVALIK